MKNKLLTLIIVLLLVGVAGTSCDVTKPPPHPAGFKAPPKPPTP